MADKKARWQQRFENFNKPICALLRLLAGILKGQRVRAMASPIPLAEIETS